MQYDGIIDESIKEEARKVLRMEDAGKPTKEAYLKAVDILQTALIKKRKPFYNKVDDNAIKFNDSSNQFALFDAKKELNEISITFDVEAEELWKKYSLNKKFDGKHLIKIITGEKQ